MREKVIRINEMITNAGKRFDPVLNSLNQLRKCMEISLDNLHTNIGDLRVNTIRT